MLKRPWPKNWQPLLYVAGPFFNPQQLGLIRLIEDHLMDTNFDFFSPRLQNGDVPFKPVTTPAQANEIWQRNVTEIDQSNLVLAVIDYLQPEGIGVWALHEATGRKIAPVQVPDTGTVFELGLALDLGKHIFLFTTRPKEQRLNLMVTQCADGIIYGLDHLKQVFSPKGFRPDLVSSWEGAYI